MNDPHMLRFERYEIAVKSILMLNRTLKLARSLKINVVELSVRSVPLYELEFSIFSINIYPIFSYNSSYISVIMHQFVLVSLQNNLQI